MTLESWAYIAEIVGAIAVVASLLYVGIQIRDSNRVNQANARHNISEFVLQISMFNAAHADRISTVQQRLSEGGELTAAERTFQWWSHMNMMLHAETFYHHYELGLMPEGHWKGYARFVESYSMAPGLAEFWGEVGPAFSRNFSNWMTGIINRNNGLSLPSHDDA
jgi:hypothetical protein